MRTNKKFSKLKECVERYKELWRIERVFKDLKNLLSIVPVYHLRRIRGHTYACFLSLVISFVIEKKASELKIQIPFEEIIEELQDLKIERVRISNKRFLVRDSLEENVRKPFFKRAGIRIPPSILETA